MIVFTTMHPAGGLPSHSHPRQTEHWSVFEGEVRFRLGGEKRVIGPADGEIPVPPHTKHGLTAVSEGDVRLRCRVEPALGIEDFLTDSAAAAREGLFMKGGVPTNLRGARWAACFLDRHSSDVEMAFPPAFAQRAMIAVFGRG